MLINFCANYLESEVKCDKPSTDGYDVNNLLTNNCGFLAYSTIVPPINIDFHFCCNIKLSHILIWPSVGSQKSTGFRISTKLKHQWNHNLLSNVTLDKNFTGMLYTTKYINKNTISTPLNFFNAPINNNIIDCLNNIRVTIFKTDRSVPAIGKIEIWAFVSQFNKRENSNRIFNLLSKHNAINQQLTKSIIDSNTNKNITNDLLTQSSESLVIPDEYLDPITCNIMIQPIILPSGKVIDQSTLENFGENEALWGRPLSDPFTGISLTNNYKPIFALQLKLKIDKFLSENSDNLEIKKLPRVIGYKNHLNVPSYSIKNIQNIQTTVIKTSVNKLNDLKNNTKHKLPIVSRQNFVSSHKNITKISKNISITKKSVLLQLKNNDETILNVNSKIDDKLKNNLENILSNLKRFNTINDDKEKLISQNNNCNCCEFPIYYKLPCNHIVCRKIILSYKNNNNNVNSQCPQCNNNYKYSQVIRIHN